MGIFQKLADFWNLPQPEPELRTIVAYRQVPVNSAGNGGEKWDNGLSRSGTAFDINNFKMMLNARRAYHDSPECRGIINALADGVIGSGLRYESAIDFEELGISQEEAQRIGSELERRFDAWASSKKCSRDGTINFYQAQKLYVKSQIRDGEVFSRLYYDNRRRDLLNPLQFSFVDPTQIQGLGFFSTGGNIAYNDGIKRNSQGEEIAYTVAFQDESAPYRQTIVEVPAQQNGRRFMLHGYMAEYAGQKRGYSHVGHILQELQDIQNYRLATLAKAEAQSKVGGFVEPGENAPASGIFDAISGAMPAGPLQPTVNTETTVEYREDGTKVTHLPEATAADPGAWFFSNLGAGETIKFAPNSAPADKLSEFMDGNMVFSTASVGVPLEVLKMQWGSSFSASRATLLQFQAVKDFWRVEFAADFGDYIVEAWVSEEIAAGRINLPGWSDPRIRSAWMKKKWVGDGVPNIDPLKEASASEKNLQLNRTTLERESKNLNGSSAASNITKNKKSFEEMPTLPWVEDTRITLGIFDEEETETESDIDDSMEEED